MFIRTAAVYISLILSVIVTLLIAEEYLPPKMKMRIDTGVSVCKLRLLHLYDKVWNKEKEYEITVKLEKRVPKDAPISRLMDYLPLQQENVYINYHEDDTAEKDNDLCLIHDSKATIQFTIQEKDVPLKKKIFKERSESKLSKDKFFNKYMDLKINGVDKYKTPQMERKMDGNKEYIELNLKGKLRYVGTNITNDVTEKPEKIYMDEIHTRREGGPEKIKITRQPSQGEGYWLKKIRIFGVDDNLEEEEKKRNNVKIGNLEDQCSIDEAIAVFDGSKIFTANPCTKENDYVYCESVGYIAGSVGETITWYYAEVIDSDLKFANPKAHELSLKLCKQKSANPDTCTVWGSMVNGKDLRMD